MIDRGIVKNLIGTAVFDGNGPMNEEVVTDLIKYIYEQGYKDGIESTLE